MSARGEASLWLMQRVTAGVLAVCVAVHLATIIYAVRGGLTAVEILSRTQGSWAWGIFYVVFVLAASLHGAIGLRNVAAEWFGLRGRSADLAMNVVAIGLTVVGLRAVAAVVLT
jgi:fumarate reductase subunit C